MENKFDEIIVIDDEEAALFYAKIILNNMDNNKPIHTFQKGKKALTFIKKNKKIIFLILLDISMPGYSGWDFINDFEKLQKDFTKKHIVVMLTNSSNPDDRNLALEKPSVLDYLIKPLTTTSLNKISIK